MPALSHGFTTGSAAAAGAKAGIILLLTGAAPDRVSIPQPPEAPLPQADSPYARAGHNRLNIPVHTTTMTSATSCLVRVVKDGGDDPDATHGAVLEISISLDLCSPKAHIDIVGGVGVGRVTRPGLPVQPGQPAINPAPMAQIRASVVEALVQHAAPAQAAVRIQIAVPEGVAIARHTMNHRLGIVGGISILGTRGTVAPFSHAAYEATVLQGMDVAKASNLSTICMTTGGRSERLLRVQLPNLAEVAFVQVADLFSFSMRQARTREFTHIVWGCFFGKLVKMAQGLGNTHAKSTKIDFDALKTWCLECGVKPSILPGIAQANTAREVLELLKQDPKRIAVIEKIASKALDWCEAFSSASSDTGADLAAGAPPAHWRATIWVFDFDSTLLTRQTRVFGH